MPDRIEIDTDALLKKGLIKLAQVRILKELVEDHDELSNLVDQASESAAPHQGTDKKPGRIKQAAEALDAQGMRVKSRFIAKWFGTDVKGLLKDKKYQELLQRIRTNGEISIEINNAEKALLAIKNAANPLDVNKSMAKAATALMKCNSLVQISANVGEKASGPSIIGAAIMGRKSAVKEKEVFNPTKDLAPHHVKALTAGASGVQAKESQGPKGHHIIGTTSEEQLKERYASVGGLKPITPQSSGGSTTSTKSATSANTSGRSRADSNSSTGSSSGMNKPPPPVPSATTEGVKPPLPNKRPPVPKRPGPGKN